MEETFLVIVEFVIINNSRTVPHEIFYEWTIENSLEYMIRHKLDHLIKNITISKYIIKYTLYYRPSGLTKKGYSLSYNHLGNNIQELWAKKI